MSTVLNLIASWIVTPLQELFDEEDEQIEVIVKNETSESKFKSKAYSQVKGKEKIYEYTSPIKLKSKPKKQRRFSDPEFILSPRTLLFTDLDSDLSTDSDFD